MTPEAAPPDPLLGKLFAGRFRISERIGEGGMGCVYKAVHTGMDRICAIKVLSPLSGDQQMASARFQREAKMSSRIESPNAVTIYDFGEAEPGQLYLVMEFIEGESLDRLLKREKSLPVERVLNITQQTAHALAAAHSLGIVHRDLKPANIMLTQRNGRELVKVVDFGIAKTITEDCDDNLTQTGFLVGTPTYMSPEQVLGEPVNSCSDIYSLAIIVYQMLSGSLPFNGENLRALLMARLNGEPKPLRASAPFISGEIEQAVMRGMERDAARRVSDVVQFATALSTAATGSTQVYAFTQTADANTVLPTQLTPSPFAESSQESIPPATGSRDLNNPTIAAVWTPPSAQPQAPAPKKRSTLTLVLIPAVLLILIVSVIGVGILIYTKTKSPSAVATQAPERKEQNDQAAADSYYQSGKKLQQEASDAGSKSAADTKYEEAIAEYRKAIGVRNNFPEAHENLGVALHTLGKVPEAIAEYEIAIKQYQTPHAQVLANYGMALILDKRYREAADALAQSLELKPNDADLYFYRGFALHYDGDEKGSREAFNKYLSEAPQGSHAKDARDILARRVVPTLN